jgi:hypothetical protein
MKKIIVILLILIGSASCKRETYLEVTNLNEDKTTGLLIGKWTVSYVDNGFSQSIGDQVMFNSDGTLGVIYKTYNISGTWKITDNIFTSDRIYNTISGTTFSYETNIEKINNNELILSSTKKNITYKIKFIK